MAANQHVPLKFTAYSASDCGEYVAVKFTGGATNSYVQVAAANTDDVVGISLASVATYGGEVPIAYSGIVKGLAAASLGAGCRVAVASTNGALGPISPSGIVPSLGPSAGIWPARYQVGRALDAAAAGTFFRVIVDPGEIV